MYSTTWPYELALFLYLTDTLGAIKIFKFSFLKGEGRILSTDELIEYFESYIPESISDILIRSKLTRKCLLTPYVGTLGNVAIFSGNYVEKKSHIKLNVYVTTHQLFIGVAVTKKQAHMVTALQWVTILQNVS